MIKVHLDLIMKKYNININQLSLKTGISRKALTLLANYNDSDSPPVSIQYNTIAVLCSFFNINVNDLISYEHDQNDFEVTPLAFDVGKNNDINLFLFTYKRTINNETYINYFITSTKLVENIPSEERTYSVPKSFFGDKDVNGLDFSEEKIIKTPAIKKYNFEVIENNNINNVLKYIADHPLYNFLTSDEINSLSDFEVTTLMKSFNKSFLAQLTARTFDFLIESSNDEQSIIVNWNFGEFSWLNASSFHFEYSKLNNTIISLDNDNNHLFKDFSLFENNYHPDTKPNNSEL